MKKPRSLILTAAFSLAVFSSIAQNGAPTYVANQLAGLPSTLAGVTQTNFPFATAPVIPVGKQGNVGLEFTGNLSAVGTNVVFTFCKSVSGAFWDTNTAGGGVLPASATILTLSFTNDVTQRTMVTNINVQGYGYLKLMSIYNKEATAVWTNLGVYWSAKISAP